MIKFSKTKLKQIAERYHVTDVYLFGSKISGFKRPDSDLDIAIRFENGLPTAKERAKIYGNIYSDLASCFKNEKIDLVFLDEAPLHFKYKIVTGGKIIYSKDMENSLNFLEITANYYRDYKFFIDEYLKGILQMSVE